MADVLRLSPRPTAQCIYEKGSIVLCFKCGTPLYKLERGLYDDQPLSNTGSAYAPVSVADIDALLERQDLDAGQRAFLKMKTRAEWHEFCERVPRLKNGDDMQCCACGDQFSRAWIPDTKDGASMFGDKAFKKVGLAVIPPFGKARPLPQPTFTRPA